MVIPLFQLLRFRATLYPCPETQPERREMSIGVMTRIEDLQAVLSQTEEHRQRVLSSAAKNVRVWFIKVRKLKAVYHTLNLFNLDVTQKCLIAECWCPVTDLDKIQMGLRRGTVSSLFGLCFFLHILFEITCLLRRLISELVLYFDFVCSVL